MSSQDRFSPPSNCQDKSDNSNMKRPHSRTNSIVSSVSPRTSRLFPDQENPIEGLEKEQEGIVLKLLHEISALKEENKMLKSKMRSSTSLLSTNGSCDSTISVSPVFPTDYTFNWSGGRDSASSLSSNSSQLSYPPQSSFMNQRRATVTTMTSLKRVPNSLSSQPSVFPQMGNRSRSGSLSIKSPVFPFFDADTTAVTAKRKSLSYPVTDQDPHIQGRLDNHLTKDHKRTISDKIKYSEETLVNNEAPPSSGLLIQQRR